MDMDMDLDRDALLLIASSLAALAIASLIWFLRRRRGKKSRKLPLPPGPRGWPVLGNLPQLGAKPHHTMAALSRQHGPLFRLRFGTAEVVVAASAKVASIFLRTHDANFSDRPPNSGAEHVAYNYQDLVFAPYGARWRALRKLCALRLFSAKALDALRAVREEEVRLMVAQLYAHASSSSSEGVAVGQEANVCATNALARAAVGRRVFGGSAAAAGEGAKEFKELMQLAGVFNIGDFVPTLRWLDPQGVVAKMKRLHRRYDGMMDGFISEREGKQQGGGDGDNKDLLSVMLMGGEGDQEEEEGMSSFNHTNIKLPESDLPRLTFLAAVIKETFRLHPSTPLSLPRVAAEDCEVGGYRVPKGTTPLVNVWAIARDPASWGPDALEFRPARFLPGGSHEGVDVKGSHYELIPFGSGRRICAGLSWGLRMVTLITATLLHAFDWSLLPAVNNGGIILTPPDKLDMEEAYGLTLQRAVPLMLHPVPRLSLPSAAYKV